MWEEFSDTLIEASELMGLELTKAQVLVMRAYAQAVAKQNEVVNLTEICEPREMAVKHFADSLACVPLIDPSATVVDVGSGAGFPGIPLKIALPSLDVTLLDSLAKRTLFLERVLRELGLRDVKVVTARSEQYGRAEGREYFDVAVARAVAKLRVLVEYCLPLVCVGGLFIAMKGPGAADEVREAMHAMGVLGAELEDVVQIDLPFNVGSRRLVCIRKVRRSPEGFPRRPGVPAKRPL